jgi:signal peptidase II
MPEREGTGRRLLGRLPVYFWIVAAVSAIADLLTKHWVISHFAERFPEITARAAMTNSTPHYPSLPIVRGFFEICCSRNHGGVFGLGQNAGLLWLAFGLIAGGAVIWFAHRKDARGLLVQIALGLVLGGAIGNVFDRVAFGYVRDFILVYYWPGKDWPAFNVADSGICVGAIYLAVYATFFAPKDEGKDKVKEKPGKD